MSTNVMQGKLRGQTQKASGKKSGGGGKASGGKPDAYEKGS